MAEKGTKTWQELLGIDSAEKNIKPTFDSTNRSSVARKTNEHADQNAPASDQRRGGTPGQYDETNGFSSDYPTEDTRTRHDGYMGRGSGKKGVSADWDEDER